MSRLTKRAVVILRWAIAPIIVAVCGAIALLHPMSEWLSAAVSFTVAASLVATVCAAFGDRRRRALRSGFAICCGGYFLLYWFGYRPDAGVNSYLDALVTTKSLNWLHDHLFPDSTVKLAPDPELQLPPSGVLSAPAGELGTPVLTPPAALPDRIHAPAAYLAQVSGVPIVGGMQPVDDSEVAQNFVQIGQCLWALFFGWLGGWFAHWLAWRQANAKAAAAQPSLPARSQ